MFKVRIFHHFDGLANFAALTTAIVQEFGELTRKVDKIMATVQEVSDKLDALAAAVTTATADVSKTLGDLAAKIAALQAAGTGATPADLDALAAKVQPVADAVAALDAAAKAADV